MASSDVQSDPKFIKYLLDPTEKYEFYYIVGNGKNNTPVEKIGIVKKMLISHSAVFNRELQDGKFKHEDNTEKITDIFPSTFKNMLRYVYGYNNTSALCFDDADDLLYAADKYLLDELKALLSTHLMSLLTYDNICSLNPAVYREMELNNEITKMIQYETNKVLASPQFLGSSGDAFLKILEQEQLQAPEIELWRSAVNWAKNRVNSEDGRTLRKELNNHLKHIRVCTLSPEEFCREAVPTRILTLDEIIEVCTFHSNNEIKPNLKELCDIVDKRKVCEQAKPSEKSALLHVSLPYLGGSSVQTQSIMTISTKAIHLELCSLVVRVRHSIQCNFTVTVENMITLGDTTTIVKRGVSDTNNKFTITFDDDSLYLLPKTQYRVVLRSNPPHNVWYCCNRETVQPVSSYSREHFTVNFTRHRSGEYITPVKAIKYKTVTPR